MRAHSIVSIGTGLCFSLSMRSPALLSPIWPHTPRSMLVSMYIGETYSTSSRLMPQRWRALIKYDMIVKSPNSPFAFRPDKNIKKSIRRAVLVARVLLVAIFFVYTGWSTYAISMRDYEHGYESFMILCLFIFSTIGLSAVCLVRIHQFPFPKGPIYLQITGKSYSHCRGSVPSPSQR